MNKQIQKVAKNIFQTLATGRSQRCVIIVKTTNEL